LSSRRNAGRIASYATEIATPKTSNTGGVFIASCLMCKAKLGLAFPSP